MYITISAFPTVMNQYIFAKIMSATRFSNIIPLVMLIGMFVSIIHLRLQGQLILWHPPEN
jgi:hypothetical protein